MEREFAVHMLNEKGKVIATEMAEKFSDLLLYCRSVSLPCHEQDVLTAKLQEACFYAKKAMAMSVENHQ